MFWDSNPNAEGEGEARQSQTHSKLASNKINDNAADLVVYSPPFDELYVY